MAIVCIKIGENEAQDYGKYERISKSMDIIEVLPRKRDKDGNIVERTMGQIGDKHFLGINVDMSSLSDEEFSLVREMLKEEWIELSAIVANDLDDNATPELERIEKRLRKLDLTKLDSIGISGKTKTKIEGLVTKKRSKQDFNAMEVNRYDIVVPFEDFAKCVVNKETNKTLDKELGLDKDSSKKIKDVIGKIKLKHKELLG